MGARGDFLSNFLWNPHTFDKVYCHQAYNYRKLHNRSDRRDEDRNTEISILIDYGADVNKMITFFAWTKRLSISPDFVQTFDPNSDFDKFTKIYFTIINSWQAQQEMRTDTYSHIIDFKNTFDADYMRNFYIQINNREHSPEAMNFLIQDNALQIDMFNSGVTLHPVELADMIWQFEQQHNLKDTQRNWSIVEILKSSKIIDQSVFLQVQQCLDLAHYTLN